MIGSLRDLAFRLDGEVVGGQVLAPGPRHGPKDRSLSVRLSHNAPDGFVAFSHAGDNWQDCKDHVKARLGIESAPRRPQEPRRRPPTPTPQDDGRKAKIATAGEIWRASVDPRGTIVETYLNSRALDLGDDVAGDVLRWHPGIGAMVALFRSVMTGEPRAVSRTFLDREGKKLGRKFLGPVGGGAIKLDADENVLGGLYIGEGVETCMSARQLGLRPAWALGSAGAIGSFPVLDGIECLTIFEENDESGTSAREVEKCAARWADAGKEIFINRPVGGSDLNDALRGPT